MLSQQSGMRRRCNSRGYCTTSVKVSVWLTAAVPEPAVPVTLMEYEPVAVPLVECEPLEEDPPPHDAKKRLVATRSSPAIAGVQRIRSLRRFTANIARTIATRRASASLANRSGGLLSGVWCETGGANELAVVATVTVIGTAVDPLTIAEVGETVQVESGGAPEQVKVTVCWNPAIGATVKPNVALWPAFTVELVGEVAVSLKSGPAGGTAACVFSIVTMLSKKAMLISCRPSPFTSPTSGSPTLK